ncbi:MAG: hypothetical protein PGN25_05725 [Methylorubrum populi]
MPPTKNTIRTLEPTVVAAPLGYRVGYISPPDDRPVTADTKPEELWIGFDPVIAWIVQPYGEDTADGLSVLGATTYPVTPDGIINGGDTYLVSPDGKWSWPDGPELKDENGARRHFIDQALRG